MKWELKGKLRAIQELKEENYCGTSDAWSFVKTMGAYYDNLSKVIVGLNAVCDKNPPYSATPERIVGAIDTTKCLVDSASIQHMRLFEENLIPKSSQLHELSFKEYKKQYPDWCVQHGFLLRNPVYHWENILGNHSVRFNLDDLLDYLKQPILKVNRILKETGTKSYFGDGLFGTIILASLFKQEDKASNEIMEILTKSSGVDWQNKLSKDNLREIEHKIRRHALGYMNYLDQFARMERDGFLKRFDYRRQILINYIEHTGITSVEDLKESLKISLNSYEPDELNERLDRFLLRTANQEENFLRRFLKS